MTTSRKKKLKRALICAAAAVILIAAFVITFSGSDVRQNWNRIFSMLEPRSSAKVQSDDFVRVIDVGQGDSILISSNGKSMLTDCGTPDSAPDIGGSLRTAGLVDIDVLSGTHLHNDHIGGMTELLQLFSPESVIFPELDSAEETAYLARNAVSKVTSDGGNAYTAVPGMNVTVGDFCVTVLFYDSELNNENDRSVITMAEIDGLKFLLMGDGESPLEKRLLAENLDLSCDMLKVGHHGGGSSTGDKLLSAANPEYAAISCGAGNIYNHPAEETVERLDEHEIKTYRTDLNGDITFYVSDGKISVDTEK